MKRITILVIVLSMVPVHIQSASEQVVQQKKEEKSGWWKTAAAGTLVAALLAYVGYQAMNDLSEPTAKPGKMNALQRNVAIAKALLPIYQADQEIQGNKQYFQQEAQEIRRIVKNVPDVDKNHDPLDINYFNRKLQNSALKAQYFAEVKIFLQFVIKHYGSQEAQNKMMNALLKIAGWNTDKEIIYAEQLKDIYDNDPSIQAREREFSVRERELENWVYNTYPNIYQRAADFNKNPVGTPRFDPFNIEILKKVSNQQFKDAYFYKLDSYYRQIIKDYGVNASKKIMKDLDGSLIRKNINEDMPL